MQIRTEIAELVRTLNAEPRAEPLRLREEDYDSLEAILQRHPDLWPTALADTLLALRRKLRWETIDRGSLPEPLLPFFDDTFRRNLDPMALARTIGQDLCSSCAECECRC